MALKGFGKKPRGGRLRMVEASENYRHGTFQNLSQTEVMAKGASYFKMMRDFVNKPKDNSPSKPIPTIKTNLKTIKSDEPTIVWFGHSSYLLVFKGKTILVDPVFSGFASPVPLFGKAFPGADAYDVEDFPKIDYLIISHDHYDHLDNRTVKKLKGKVGHIYTSLGVGSHLEHWGFPAEQITEMDWWETLHVEKEIDLTATPARHFSGRGIARAKTLWSSFVLNIYGVNLYLGGDSGYDTHFKSIGQKYGPFDLAILETGQYNIMWPAIHMMPEEAVKAAQDLDAKMILPVHWAKFSLALHPWTEPVERVLAEAEKQEMPITTPMIGEPLVLGKSHPDKKWWNF